MDFIGDLGDAYYQCLKSSGVVATTLFGLAISLIALRIAYSLLTFPMRRAGRARLFLDLIESAIKHGQPIEEALISLAQSRDTTLGVRFHLLTAHLEQGLTLGDGLLKVPQFLPPQINAMFLAGQKIGDVRKVLPACRQLLKDAIPQTRSALNYLLLLTFVISPFSICVMSVLDVVVLPKFREIAAGTLFGPADRGVLITGFDFVWGYSNVLIWVQILLLALLWLAVFCYIGGPRVAGTGRFQYAVPWRRKRLQRDFSTMLALLLDAGVPESDAVTLAANCTANEIFRRRAARVVAALKQGTKLTEAVQAVDDSGEFAWRLTNAIHGHGCFLRALAGWHESLDARAFQQEQTAAHGITTGLVVWSGVFIGAVVVSVFSVLVAFTNAGVLW
jgi:type II secretory pathway component PulF